MPDTVSLVRKIAKVDKNGYRWCCEKCIFAFHHKCCDDAETRMNIKEHSLYCGAMYYWALKPAAKKRKGEE